MARGKDHTNSSSLPYGRMDGFYLGHCINCFSCCKAIKYLDENTEEPIPFEIVCLNDGASDILVLGIKRDRFQHKELL